ncbi:MAG: gliding motility-associated C-terminal domain-containing protein [Candidatus Pacebacteria bacterium]|nr:gliding motility-associated C-terminal domain-containing protein [Candidatus Paceibacterota bacterium]MBP9851193.1 gliding motility-associated C-terminal domain-containing protein [Candidatus Paceibacterota bacterium]
MKKLNLTLAFLVAVDCISAQDLPLQNQPGNNVQPRGDCIEVLNTSQFFAGEFGGGQGTSSVCFSFPSTCGAEGRMNSNSVVDFLQFSVGSDTSGVIGVGSSGFGDLEYLSVGQVVLLPFDFSPPRAFEGPIHIDVGSDGFIVEKLSDGLTGDMFFTVSLQNFSITLLSNRSHFTNYSIECKPLNVCADYVGVQYAVACPGKDLFLVSKCYDSDYKTIWINPEGDTIICELDTLRVNDPVSVGAYQWITPCNKGYVLVYNPDSVRIENRQIFCSSKQKLFLPTGLKGNWSNGVENSNYIQVTSPGTYWVNVSNCIQDSIAVDIIFEDLDLDLHFVPDVDTILFFQELKVIPEAISGTTFTWQKDGQPVWGYYGTGLYTITGTYDECREQDTILVIPELFSECDWPVYKPTVFSPNSDGVNDLFQVFGPDGSVSKIWVYDRWGGLMYSGEAWDGTWESKELKPGVYTFKARVVWGFEECSRIYGDVTLIR